MYFKVYLVVVRTQVSVWRSKCFKDVIVKNVMHFFQVVIVHINNNRIQNFWRSFSIGRCTSRSRALVVSIFSVGP